MALFLKHISNLLLFPISDSDIGGLIIPGHFEETNFLSFEYQKPL